MNTTLRVVLCQTHDQKPLASIDGLPGDGAELTPAQLRDLAATLVRIANDAEARPMRPRTYRRHVGEYAVTSERTNCGRLCYDRTTGRTTYVRAARVKA